MQPYQQRQAVIQDQSGHFIFQANICLPNESQLKKGARTAQQSSAIVELRECCTDGTLILRVTAFPHSFNTEIIPTSLVPPLGQI